jgi:hypothetical protein
MGRPYSDFLGKDAFRMPANIIVIILYLPIEYFIITLIIYEQNYLELCINHFNLK